MAEEVGEDDRAGGRFLKALVLSVGALALCTLLIFIPVAGPALLVTVAPFTACYFGARRAGLDTGRGWLWLGLCAGAIISTVQTAILIQLVSLFGPVDLFEPIGLSLVAVLFCANIVFGALGSRRGAAEGA
jgi:hypothetical protein